MRLTRRTRLFFDASVLIAGSHSLTGASALVLEACKRGGFQACASTAILKEVEENVRRDLPPPTLLRFYALLADIAWSIGPFPSTKQVEGYYHLVDPKDAHVIASAVSLRSEFLLTLDKKHLLTDAARLAALPVVIVSPGEFIRDYRDYYHLHEDYPSSLPQKRNPD